MLTQEQFIRNFSVMANGEVDFFLGAGASMGLELIVPGFEAGAAGFAASGAVCAKAFAVVNENTSNSARKNTLFIVFILFVLGLF